MYINTHTTNTLAHVDIHTYIHIYIHTRGCDCDQHGNQRRQWPKWWERWIKVETEVTVDSW